METIVKKSLNTSRKITICKNIRRILYITLVWPHRDEELNPGYLFYIRFWILAIVSQIIYSFTVNHVFVLLEANMHLYLDICTLIGVTESSIMAIMYVLNQKEIAELLVELSNFETFGAPPNLKDFLKKMNSSARAVISYVTFIVVGHSMFNFTQRSNCRQKHIRENCGFMMMNTTPKPLVLGQDPGLYFLYFITEAVVVYSCANVPIMVSYQLFELCHHFILRIEHLKMMLKECFAQTDPKKLREHLNNCLAYHIDIIRLSIRANEIFQSFMLLHLLTTMFLVAVSLYIVMEGRYEFISFLSNYTLVFFVGCLGGQQLTNASGSLADFLYDLDWPSQSLDVQKDMSLFILRSNDPLRMWTGKFYSLSYPLFIFMLKGAYSFIALLNSVK